MSMAVVLRELHVGKQAFFLSVSTNWHNINMQKNNVLTTKASFSCMHALKRTTSIISLTTTEQ